LERRSQVWVLSRIVFEKRRSLRQESRQEISPSPTHFQPLR